MSARAVAAAFTLAALAAIAVTPLEAGFTTRPFACDPGLGTGDWIADVGSARHLVAYAILGGLAFFALRGRPLWQPVGLVVLITCVVELEQAVFLSGDCRLRDMVPNFMAVTFGTAFALLMHVWLNRRRS